MSVAGRWVVLLAHPLVACRPALPPEPAEQVRQAPLRFAVLGDRADEPNDAAWRAVIDAVAARRPDLVLTVGDLVDDALDPTDWDTALASAARVGVPVEFTPGNHDILDEATARTFQERTGQAPWRSFDRGGVHFAVVDTSIAESWDTLPEPQRTWLADDLGRAEGPIVVLTHKPFWALGAAVGKPDPLHDLFVASGVDLVLTGHWHTHLHARVDGVEYVGVGTSGGAYGGLQDVLLGNAYEFAWVEVAGGEVRVRMLAGGRDLPADYVTLADSQRLRALRMGAVSAVARDGRIELAVRNLSEAPLVGAVAVDPGAWTVDELLVPLTVDAGATFTTSLAARPGERLFPTPRIRLDYPLPDAGVVPYEAPVDVRREVRAPRGSATVDGRLDEWAGAEGVTTWTTAAGLPAETEPTTLWLRHDDEALYVAARCEDSAPDALQRHHSGRDGQVVYDDRVGVLLFPAPDTWAWVYVNPNGAVWDLRKVDGAVDRTWDGVEAAATVDASGWSVEARVPLAAFGLAEPPATWGFDARRKQERLQAEATFTPAFGTRDPARIGRLVLE